MLRSISIFFVLLVAGTAHTQQPPVAADDMVRVTAGTTNRFSYLHLNDIDPDGNELAMVPVNGVTYIPATGFAGVDSISYVVGDGTGRFATGTVTVAVNDPLEPEAARDQLLDGVTSIASGVQPGKLVLFGPTAYAVNWFAGAGEYDPIAGIASWGHGKVIAMPDHQMLEVDDYESSGDTVRFVFNGLAWLSGTTNQSIRIVTYHAAHRDWFVARGYTNTVSSSESSLTHDLAGADVFFAAWLGSSEPDGNLAAIGDFVKAGGGLFICDYGVGYDWWWNKSLPDVPGNRLLKEAGIGFCGGNHWDTGTIIATNRPSMSVHFDTALAMLEDSSGFTAGELEIGGELLARTAEVLPDDDILIARRNVFFFDRIVIINPTPTTAVSDPFEKSLLLQEADILANVPVEEVAAHRTADAVYGAVPANAPRVSGTVPINGNRTRWLATGFYAVPGEVVTVTVPEELVGNGYRIRINAHTDNIQQRGSWERPPVVHRAFEITTHTMQVASAFGGAIFIDLGGGNFESSPPAYGMLEISVSGAVRHPWFDLDMHSDADWNAVLRNQPGPYGVLVSSNLVCVLPKHQIESVDLTEPERLMAWWNEVVQLEDELANRGAPRTGAEMINVDVQNSAGAAHSGYPVQAYEKYWGNLADVEHLTAKGSWGDFHELGHNHQRGWWKFAGDGEVTCNVFSTYCLRNMASAPDAGGWGWTVDPVAVIQRAAAAAQTASYLDTASLSDRLSFWVQLADGFGWDAYLQVLGSYEQDHAAHPEALPSSDQEDMEQWLVRFSNQVGSDLSGFMVDTWGFPIGTSVVAQVSSLPDWMPVIGGMPDRMVPVNTPHLLDYAASAYSMDGVADVIAVSEPVHGKLIDNSNGTWTYEPDFDFSGSETFVYTLRSSAGNTLSFTNRISVSSQGAYMERWNGIPGSSLPDLTGSPNYPEQPDETGMIDSLRLSANTGDNYGTRIRALLIPPETGLYSFWIASDDSSRLMLGTNESPQSASAIAEVSGWTGEQEWTRYASQQSSLVSLVAGQKYYVEVLQKEGSGGDHLAVAWQTPSGTDTNIISAEYLELPPGLYPEVDNARTWAGRHGLAGADLSESADPDGDGHSNREEFEARTDPNNSADVLKLEINPSSVAFNAVSGKTYRVEYRNALVDSGWKYLSEFTATQNVLQISDPGSGSQPVRFYRLLVNP